MNIVGEISGCRRTYSLQEYMSSGRMLIGIVEFIRLGGALYRMDSESTCNTRDGSKRLGERELHWYRYLHSHRKACTTDAGTPVQHSPNRPSEPVTPYMFIYGRDAGEGVPLVCPLIRAFLGLLHNSFIRFRLNATYSGCQGRIPR